MEKNFRPSFSLEPLTLISLSILILCTFYTILCKFRRVYELSGHGPPTYPLFGCLFSFYKNRHRLLDWYTDLLSQSPTNTIVVRRLGAQRTIVTANPENVEYILKTNFNNFPKGKPFTEILGDFLGCGIFNVDGELWRTQRKLASHEFSTKSLREFVVSTLEEEIETRLLPELDLLAAEGEEVDLQELLRRLSFNTVCKVSLGIDAAAVSKDLELSRAFHMASMVCAGRGAAPLFIVWKIKRWLGIGSEKMLKNAVEEVRQYVSEIISERKKKMIMINEKEKEEKNCKDLLSRLIAAGHGEEVIRDMMISFIMAGRDTTSAAMTWLFWLLSDHKSIQHDIVKEINSVIKKKSRESETLNQTSLKELRLLEACLCESMRLYPPVAWDSKHAISADLLPDGTPVQAGDRVTYFPYGMGRMEALWGKDQMEFKPERWFDAAERELKRVCPYRFPVFQAGPRVCLGKEMAYIQMKYVVAAILGRFEVRPVVGSERPVFVPLLTAHMAGGFKVVIRKRSGS